MLRRLVVVCTILVLCSQLSEAQRRQNNRNNRQNNRNNRQSPFRANGVTRNGSKDRAGTEVYPGCDGKVCLPEAQLCANRKNKVGEREFGGKSYWFSWDSDEGVLRNARWNWFTARNYCRKRCMDLVSIESRNEQDFLGREMKKAGVREIWTSARLCDKEVDGCEQARFQPYNIRGWFWAATLQGMGETNVFNGRKFNGWSGTGPIGKSQPDGLLKADGFGEQACAALLDNFFGDGLSWHDTKCNDRRLIVCEDLPAGNINFVRQNNPGIRIP